MVNGAYELCVRFPTSAQLEIVREHLSRSRLMRLNGNEPNIDHVVDAKEGRLVGLISAQSLGLCNPDDPTLQPYHAKLRKVFDYLKKYNGAFQEA